MTIKNFTSAPSPHQSHLYYRANPLDIYKNNYLAAILISSGIRRFHFTFFKLLSEQRPIKINTINKILKEIWPPFWVNSDPDPLTLHQITPNAKLLVLYTILKSIGCTCYISRDIHVAYKFSASWKLLYF